MTFDFCTAILAFSIFVQTCVSFHPPFINVHHKYSDVAFQSCVCYTCKPTEAFGFVQDGVCYYVFKLLTSEMAKSWARLISLRYAEELHPSDPNFIDVVHILSNHAYKRFDVTDIRLNLLPDGGKTHFFFRLPSIPILDILRPVYNIETNLIFDDIPNKHIESPRIMRSLRTIYNQTTDQFIPLPSSTRNECFAFQYDSKPETYVEISDRLTFEGMQNLVIEQIKNDKTWVYRDGLFIIKFDPTNVPIRKTDYFMHVPSHLNATDPFVHHLVIARYGKMFQIGHPDDALYGLLRLTKGKRVMKLVKLC